MAKIESLTPEQWAEVHQHRDQVIERCLNQPLDHNKIGQSIGACYEAVGEKPPLAIVWAPGPVAALAWSAILRAEGEKPEARQLGGQLGGQLRGQLGDQLRGQLGGQLWGQLGLEISAWWDAYWLAYYTCALPFADLEASPRLDALATVCEEAGWWWPMHGAVVLTDRPTTINRDKEGRLHSGDGPTLAYADGYELYSWHGTRVPADLIGGWTIPQIVAERNTEVRRCAVERMGWDVFLAEADATLVAEADDPGNSPHTLRLYDLPDYLDDAFSEPARIVLCTNGSAERDGTRHRYGITVRKRFNDPVAAMADTYGVATEVYRQLETRR